MEHIAIEVSATKKEKYEMLLPQIKALICGEASVTANMANTAAALKQTFDFFWCGWYLVEEEHLVLGPFQGPVACTRIDFGKGVCGTAWKEQQTIVVDDVDNFIGHIACSSLSRSEIVIPFFKDGTVAGVLDIDSIDLASFDETDAFYLAQVCALFSE